MEELLGIFLRPFVAWVIIAWVLGQLVKTYVFTVKRAVTPGKLRKWFWKPMRRSMVIHPAVIGIGIGWFWQGKIDTVMETDYVGGALSGVAYFVVAGIVATWGYRVVREWVKKKYDVELPDKLPGASSLPPPPKDDPEEEEKTPVEKPK